MNAFNVRCTDGICVIELDRPAKKNALTKAMYEGLAEAIANAAEDPDIKVLLLQGSNHVFSAGNDLEDFLENPPAGDDAPVFNFIRTLMNFPKPVVAAVEGLAIGIGATLLLHCDLVYTTAATRFSFPFTGLGVVPEAGSTWLLPRLMGYQQAAEKLFFGEVFNGEEAWRIGLVNRLLAEPELYAYAHERSLKLASLPVESLRLTKQLLKGQLGADSGIETAALATRISDEADLFVKRLQSPDTQAGLKAFVNKSRPA